jgi:DNA polymerase III delta prime subunit
MIPTIKNNVQFDQRESFRQIDALARPNCTLFLIFCISLVSLSVLWGFESVYPIAHFDLAQGTITLRDDSTWSVGWWYRPEVSGWHVGDEIRLTYTGQWGNSIRMEHVASSQVVWGRNETAPDLNKSHVLLRVSSPLFSTDGQHIFVLDEGSIFSVEGHFVWKRRDPVFIFHDEKQGFTIWNLAQHEILQGVHWIGREQDHHPASLVNLEYNLSKKIVGQQEALGQIADHLMSRWVGSGDCKAPIAVFLLLGSTGVGKTELAKVLSEALLGSASLLTRFDMSHFAHSSSLNRLIGSPPGYIDHERGGQLTSALTSLPHTVILLDEIEKADPLVQKFFLPIFDEGYVTDMDNRVISCQQAIFVLTSNLCAEEIGHLFAEGYTADEVLRLIEPKLMKELSFELYNRVIPILFQPLSREHMRRLVELRLEEVIQELEHSFEVTVEVSENVKKILIQKGFHPKLGARPLRRYIDRYLVKTVSRAVLFDAFEPGTHLRVDYDDQSQSWSVQCCAGA